jgi:hypothetical protein
MKRKILILFLILLTKNIYCQQKDSCSRVILLEEFNLTFENPKLNDTIIKRQNDTIIITTFYNCLGAGIVKEYKDSVLIATGKYCSSLDTLSVYQYLPDPNGPVLRISVFKYFQPVKDGEWIYRDKDGKFIKREKWDKGNLLF